MAESSPESAAPSAEFLRAAAAQQGVFLSDEDVEGVLGFLVVVLPRLAGIEARIPKGTPA